MSYALLRDKYHIVRIPDEIESFFNVVFYNALHYLPHNQQREVLHWIKYYFDDHNDYNDGEHLGGWGRHAIIQSGQLEENDCLLVFGSMPLNIILEQMLLWFHSRYKIAAYERNRNVTDNDPTPSRQRQRIEEGKDGGDEQTQGEKGKGMEGENDSMGEDDDDFIYRKKKLAGPTDEDRELNGFLQTHATVRKLFRAQRSKNTWPENEKWEDHVANCHSAVPNCPTLVTVTSTDTGTTPSMRIDAISEGTTTGSANTGSVAGPAFTLNNDHALSPKIGGRRYLTSDSKMQLSFELKAAKSKSRSHRG